MYFWAKGYILKVLSPGPVNEYLYHSVYIMNENTHINEPNISMLEEVVNFYIFCNLCFDTDTRTWFGSFWIIFWLNFYIFQWNHLQMIIIIEALHILWILSQKIIKFLYRAQLSTKHWLKLLNMLIFVDFWLKYVFCNLWPNRRP